MEKKHHTVENLANYWIHRKKAFRDTLENPVPISCTFVLRNVRWEKKFFEKKPIRYILLPIIPLNIERISFDMWRRKKTFEKNLVKPSHALHLPLRGPLEQLTMTSVIGVKVHSLGGKKPVKQRLLTSHFLDRAKIPHLGVPHLSLFHFYQFLSPSLSPALAQVKDNLGIQVVFNGNELVIPSGMKWIDHSTSSLSRASLVVSMALSSCPLQFAEFLPFLKVSIA